MTFAIKEYKQRTARLEWADLDLPRAFAERPLDEGALRCLRYMHDVEFHTICYLRELLLTPAHAEPDITAFLTFWAFEEFWHGEAIADVLAAHAEPSGTARVKVVRSRNQDRLSLVTTMIASHVFTSDFVALHMTWGAINEWTTQAAYAQLSRRAGHPVLTELVHRIMRQEGRHIDFYATQAHDRLSASRRAQRLTRGALRRFWQPVGSGVMPRIETDFLATHLFGGADGLTMAARIDRRIDALPGLADLGLVVGAQERAIGLRPGKRPPPQMRPGARRIHLTENS